MPRRSFSRRRARPRRKLVWARSRGTLSVPLAIPPALDAPARLDLLLEFEQSLGSSVVGTTLVRTRGYMGCFDTDALAENIDARIRATCYIGNNNEIQRGPNANDNAFDNLSENKDYFLFEPFSPAKRTTAGDTVGLHPYAGGPLESRMIDVKSSRKIEELNQTVILDVSAESTNNNAENSIIAFNFDLSLLLALP